MAIINSYPIGTPKSDDLLVGASVPGPGSDDAPITRNFPISSIFNLSPPILTSPGGNRFRVDVSDTGVVTTTPI